MQNLVVESVFMLLTIQLAQTQPGTQPLESTLLGGDEGETQGSTQAKKVVVPIG